ncbi:MAG: SMP-30/gluconolactonase/LRE family protein [Tepidiformaceae bacterium]
MDHRVVTEGLQFPEGPLELPGGDILLTEIRAGVLTRVRPDGTKSLFATTGGGPNGAALGPDGAIYVTQNGGFEWHDRKLPDGSTIFAPGDQPADYIGGQIQRVSADGGEVTALYRSCGEQRLRGPNDLVFDAEGNFYFTDLGKTRPREADRGAIYYASADGKMIREAVFPMERPNGIGLSPDGSTLYVAETPTNRVWACEVTGPGEIGRRRVLGSAPAGGPANLAMLDSLCVDSESNVIVATLVNGGLTSIAPDGSATHYPTGDYFTTNACFGGPGLRRLYVTLSTRGQLVAFDDWPTRGLKLHFQA